VEDHTASVDPCLAGAMEDHRRKGDALPNGAEEGKSGRSWECVGGNLSLATINQTHEERGCGSWSKWLRAGFWLMGGPSPIGRGEGRGLTHETSLPVVDSASP